MGASLSTIGGWSAILAVAGWYAYRYYNDGRRRGAARIAAHRPRVEDRREVQVKKEVKPKKPRTEAFSKDHEESDKAAKAKQRPAKTPNAQAVAGDYSTDDGMDNREFARSMAGVKQGTSFTGPKQTDDKKQRSVKQSRAQEILGKVPEDKLSAPSSTTGADADDDQSPIASPVVRAVDSGDVSDMLEKPAPGPSVLRIVNTEEPKAKERKAKAPEKVETKKQRQNKRKAEEAKVLREQAEEERQVKLEAQRRTVRLAEGRAAKDGTEFLASRVPVSSAWAATGANGAGNNSLGDGAFIPVQPLDTFEPPKATNGANVAPAKPVQTKSAAEWQNTVPSEEEQMKMLQDDQEWSTVNKKKANKGRKKDTMSSNEESDGNHVTKPQQVVPVTSAPVVTKSQQQPLKSNGRPVIGQQSSFAALGSKDEGPEQEEEWEL